MPGSTHPSSEHPTGLLKDGMPAGFLAFSLGWPDLATKNARCPVQSEFQVNNK